jgi:hypothetical protein
MAARNSLRDAGSEAKPMWSRQARISPVSMNPDLSARNRRMRRAKIYAERKRTGIDGIENLVQVLG